MGIAQPLLDHPTRLRRWLRRHVVKKLSKSAFWKYYPRDKNGHWIQGAGAIRGISELGITEVIEFVATATNREDAWAAFRSVLEHELAEESRGLRGERYASAPPESADVSALPRIVKWAENQMRAREG